MSSSYAFLGAGFSVASAFAPSATIVQIAYTSVPQAFSASSSTDALNPANYALAGPNAVTVTHVTMVGGNPQIFDLYTSGPMASGPWVVTVSNVLDPFNVPLSSPDFADFTVSAASVIPPLTPPVQFDDPIIRKHLSPGLFGDNWDGLIAALEQGDIYNRENAEAAFNQLFISTAVGPYLTAQAANYGVQQPPNVGMSDALFRQLVISLNTNKVVQEAIREILEVFYGQDSLRAFAQAGTDGPYNLSGGVFDLQWTVDERQSFSYTFQTSDFFQPGQAQAIEVAAVLTRIMEQAGSEAFATNSPSPTSTAQRVRIYSPSLGLRSSVRVTGGMAQNVLQFPSLVNPYTGSVTAYTWVYTRPVQGTTLLTLTISGTPLINFAVLEVGDYVIIQSAGSGTPFQGTFPITGVTYEYVSSNLVQTISIPQISTTGSFVQTANSGYTFYRPTKNGIYEPNGRTVIVSQSVPGRIDISIPATTAAVNRTLQDGAYLHVNAAQDIIRYQRDPGTVTLTFASPHGLSVGQQVYIDGAQPATSIPFIDFTTGIVDAVTVRNLGASLCTCSVEVGLPPSGTNAQNLSGCLLTNGQVLSAGGNVSGALASAQRWQVASTGVIADGTEADGAIQYNTQYVTTADMNQVRYDDGQNISTLGSRAVVAGGFDGTNYLTETEVYDPGANTWTTEGTLHTGRAFHVVLDLLNGTALAVGGVTTGPAVTATAEVFNGTSWATTGTMGTTRSYFTATRLANGQVLAAGGFVDLNFTLTPTSEVWNGSTWSQSGYMNFARFLHAAVLLPNGNVLVAGGLAVPASLPAASTGDWVLQNTVEQYTPATGRWSPLPSMSVARQDFSLVLVPALNRVYAIGYSTVIEYLDLATMTWHVSPAQLTQTSAGFQRPVAALMPAGNAIYVAVGNSAAGAPSPELLEIASETVSAGNLNDLFVTISATPSGYTAQYETMQDAVSEGYSSNFSNFNPAGFALSLSRTGGITTATMTIPAGYVVNLQPGNLVYVNVLSTSGLVSGLKTVLTATSTSFTYAEAGGAVGPITAAALSLDINTAAILTPWKEVASVPPLLGPYIYDPTGGLAVTSGNSTTTMAVFADQQYNYIEVAPTTSFPAAGGYIALGFGFQTQTPPILLLEVYTGLSGNTRLVIDYSYRFTSSFAVGSEVTLLTGKAPYEPITPQAEQTGGFWLTDSPAGRLAAEGYVSSSLAAGITENLVIVYPGDIGLGGAGLPTQGAQKLSDIVYVFAGDTPEAEEQAARMEPAL